ncbi:UNKNOWN [Stylonychia lemnae]|uniref:Uncharacterized protein n=1 Tax=Stylonychia lemnae TaxID=5949 RepID=A0A078B2K5_STYLE|nr:UNKNOWN [Stylonychia lemnae]|eukprot:CDW88714.1 UNKNOWN [Stylonychia lemnae]
MEAAFERLHLVHARLLFLITQMFEQNIINHDQKINLKYAVLKDDQQLLDLYEQNKDDLDNLVQILRELAISQSQAASSRDMNGDQTEETNRGNAGNLFQGEGSKANNKAGAVNSLQVNTGRGEQLKDEQLQIPNRLLDVKIEYESKIIQLSSPLGDGALNRKKERQQKIIQKTTETNKVAAIIETNDSSQSTHISMQGCDIGMSPVMQKFTASKAQKK